MHLRVGPGQSVARIVLGRCLQQRGASSAPTEGGGPSLEPSGHETLCFALYGSYSSQGRGGSRSPLQVRPMEEGRKSSLSYRPAALPKPFCSERLRIDWNNRCALVRVILR
jgi:hypothetical protein